MSLPEKKVIVEVLKDGRWAQEPWLPQLEVVAGNKVSISISIAYKLEKKGKCRIIVKKESAVKIKNKLAKQIKHKSEKNPATLDKKAAEG